LDGLGTVNLVWGISGGNAPGGTFFGQSANGGGSFSSFNISPIVAHAEGAGLAVTPSGIIDISDIAENGVFSTIITNGGAGSLSPVMIDGPPDDSDNSFELMAVAGPQGQIYVVWQREYDIEPQCDIMFSRSLDGGTKATLRTRLLGGSLRHREMTRWG
jgi:hypothetical protein